MAQAGSSLPSFPAPLLELRSVSQCYRRGSGEMGDLILENVSLRLEKGEIVGLLGRSGCGKSSLLRIIAGLSFPSAGDVFYQGQKFYSPPEGIAMVFQSFALFPWLSVLANTALGLQAQNVPAAEARQRALAAIDLIGLDGFESAYPKELSGGMRQRVGFARAFVTNPALLLMDEPFSALDVLTAETLRTDLLDLWIEKRMPIQSILMVTHNIEEAVLMCDRILILSSHPGRVAAEVKVNLPHPRQHLDPEFQKLVDQIYGVMTSRIDSQRQKELTLPNMTLDMPLPQVSTNTLAGMLEEIAAAPYNGKADLPTLADSLQLEVDDLFPVAETLQLLRFAEVADGDIRLTLAGRQFAEGDVDLRKKLFGDHLLSYVFLARHIRQVLDERSSHRASAIRFREELEDYMSDSYAETTLRSIITWGRYGEIFAYDETAQVFSLDNPK